MHSHDRASGDAVHCGVALLECQCNANANVNVKAITNAIAIANAEV